MRILPVALAIVLSSSVFAVTPPPTDSKVAPAAAWNQAAAAKYMDDRQVWWQEWPHAQKDHGTVCVSCHTQVPYALARPLLRKQLGEQKVSDPERAMLDSILKRVALGNEATTFYTDAEHGAGKTKEARNAESVNNALILVSYDAADSKFQPATRRAFEEMWALQEQSGDKSGAWIWQDFHFSPWEAPESEYYGAAMAALATGLAPDHYADDPKIQSNLTLLRAYLKREYGNQPLINKIALLWASANLPGLMTEPEKKALAAEIFAKQHSDGGWSLTELGLNEKGESSWKRHDKSALDPGSDGYATGLTLVALEEAGFAKPHAGVTRGLAWLTANQSKTDGLWPAWSVNVKRDPASDIGKFMSDAATGFSILALEHSH
jgi:squalene-hopene/tetraprenyl-beta-curcumene cyclase